MKYVIFFLCAMLLAAPSLFSQTAFGDGSPQSIDDGGYIGLNTTNCWYFSGSNIYTLGANVGIGIIPSQRLTVYEAGTETQLMIRADNDQSSGLYLGSTANDISGYFVTTHSTGRMDFGGTAGNTMVLDNPNKRVGIGTTSPSDAIHIKRDGDYQIKLENSATGGGNWRIAQTDDSFGSGGGMLIFNQDGSASASSNVCFTNAGKVGIGTTSPSEVLHVEYSGPTKIQVKTTSASSYASFKGTCGTTNNNNYAFGQNYSTSGRFIASSVLVESEGSGGLGLSGYAGDIKFWTNGNNDRGSFDVSGTFETNGGREYNITTVNAATYDLLVTDHILHVTYTGTGTVAIDWKTAQMVAGRVVIIKDAGGNANTFNITITTEGAQTIDGAATAVINGDYDSISIYCDGSNLFTF